jgi:hypothetical protein
MDLIVDKADPQDIIKKVFPMKSTEEKPAIMASMPAPLPPATMDEVNRPTL